MRLIIFVTALSALAQTGPDRLAAAYQDRALNEQAQRLATDDRIAMYQAMAAARPDNAHYQNLLAGAYIQKVRDTTDYSYLERAAQLLENVLSLDSNNYEALRLRTEIELERHGFAQAADYSRRLTKLAPQDPWNWGTLGDALIELGDYNGSAEAYQRMVTLRPDMASYNRAAYFRFIAGDLPGAIEIMAKAIASGSSSAENLAWCYVELGNLRLKGGETAAAAESYRQALRIFPNYHPALAGQGRVLALNGETQRAIDSYRKAQAATPLPDYAAALYDLYLAAGRKQEADQQMQMVDVIDRLGQAAREKANRNLAMIYLDRDRRVERALQLAQAELDIRKDVYTYDALAWALYRNKRYDEADKAAAEALKMGTPEPMFYYHAGLISLAQGRKAEAAQRLKKALTLNPRFDPRQAPAAESALEASL
ncbi:MAG: tetratricopeptide repeat protein [Acidobacteria bacterium]|nr:tetratricopeptide repeat protein [Acidobacteriota bacterium]